MYGYIYKYILYRNKEMAKKPDTFQRKAEQIIIKQILLFTKHSKYLVKPK